MIIGEDHVRGDDLLRGDDLMKGDDLVIGDDLEKLNKSSEYAIVSPG